MHPQRSSRPSLADAARARRSLAPACVHRPEHLAERPTRGSAARARRTRRQRRRRGRDRGELHGDHRRRSRSASTSARARSLALTRRCFPQCGFRIHGDAIDPECLCDNQYLCPIGHPTTCAEAAQRVGRRHDLRLGLPAGAQRRAAPDLTARDRRGIGTTCQRWRAHVRASTPALRRTSPAVHATRVRLLRRAPQTIAARAFLAFSSRSLSDSRMMTAVSSMARPVTSMTGHCGCSRKMRLRVLELLAAPARAGRSSLSTLMPSCFRRALRISKSWSSPIVRPTMRSCGASSSSGGRLHAEDDREVRHLEPALREERRERRLRRAAHADEDEVGLLEVARLLAVVALDRELDRLDAAEVLVGEREHRARHVDRLPVEERRRACR